MRSWHEIRTLPPEEQEAAIRAVERRQGEAFRPAAPSWNPCPHPPELHVRAVDRPGGVDREPLEVIFCHLCGDDGDDHARALLKYLRNRPEQAYTSRLLSLELKIARHLVQKALERLENAGFTERVGTAREDSGAGFKDSVVWQLVLADEEER